MRILCIGAHPDDCEIGFGGTAARFAASGHAVKFLSATHGGAGHHLHPRERVACIRLREAEEAARRLGIAAVEVLGVADGELLPGLCERQEMVRQIRRWEADLVLTHRPWDYHPDHRYTGQVVQDSAYLVQVPHVCPEVPVLRRNPVFLYLEDPFRQPAPFQPEIAVDIDEAWDRKVAALDAHASQMYEWLPWVEGTVDSVPRDPAQRRAWLSASFERPLPAAVRAVLAWRYGAARARGISHAESFQVCEYGRKPSAEELDEMFPR